MPSSPILFLPKLFGVSATAERVSLWDLAVCQPLYLGHPCVTAAGHLCPPPAHSHPLARPFAHPLRAQGGTPSSCVSAAPRAGVSAEFGWRPRAGESARFGNSCHLVPHPAPLILHPATFILPPATLVLYRPRATPSCHLGLPPATLGLHPAPTSASVH